MIKVILKYKHLIYLIMSVVGFILLIVSLCVHVLSILEIDVQEQFYGVWLLHIALLVMAVPYILLTRTEEKQDTMKSISESLQEIKNYKERQPEDKGFSKWLPIITGLLAVYMIFNFFIFGLSGNGQPHIVDGKFVLNNHGAIREVDEKEYHIARARLLRGFSGHWIFFYFIFATGAYSAVRTKQDHLK